jgi:hypothetical protein
VTGPIRVGTRGAARAGIVILAQLGVAAGGYAGLAAALSASSAMSMQRLPLWSVLAGTALVGWLLRCLRAPVGALADRIVHGGNASGYAEARSLVSRLAAALPVDEVLPQLAAAIGRSVRSPRTEVRCWLSPGQRWHQVWPESVLPQGDPLTLEVRHLGAQVGEIEVDQVDGPLDVGDRHRLDRMVAPVGAALATVRLTHALRIRRADLERSTAAIDESTRRLIGARRVEQRRFHDRLAARVLPLIDAALDAGTAEQAADLAEQALHEVRSLSRGVFPPRLAEAGLPACLADWADGMPARVRVRADEVPDLELRTCLYFAVVTAGSALLAGGADRVDVDVRCREGSVGLRMRTAGGGRPGWPLAVRDRLEAFGAVLSDQAAGDRPDSAGGLLTARLARTTANEDHRDVAEVAP